MTKNSSTWVILTFCGVLILGGMGWLSSHVIAMEEERARAATEAELQGRIRLGLSRIDTAASGLLLIENQRPPYHFRTFYQPDDVFSNDFENLDKGTLVRPSPLASELPEFVNLHFEVSPDGIVQSPQVPTVDDAMWGKIIAPSPQVMQSATSNLERLRQILASPPQQPSAAGFGSNLDMMCSGAVTTVTVDKVAEKILGKSSSWLAEQRADNGAQEVLNSSSYQAEFSRVEKGTRAAVYNDAVKKAVQESGNTEGNRYQAKSKDAPSAARRGKLLSAEVGEDFDDLEAAPVHSEISPFHALWAAGELFAVRSVETGGVKRFQGVWFDADALGDYLVGTVKSDLLPKASLEAVGIAEAAPAMSRISSFNTAHLNEDPLGLVTMPWRLVPGESISFPPIGWSELRLSLGLGWIAALFGLLAAAVLMRGVMRLSERRASFVSSVTHELRTPLTTFQLYSDMLAEGMVTDEAKKLSYLKTLRKEAGRLNHLIENVLAYSRIERGAAKTRSESLSLQDLIHRLQPRLEQRVQDESASLTVELENGSEEALVHTDVGAVEQIVFNLVENSCKYGQPETGAAAAVILRARADRKGTHIEVCDNGRGIARSDRSRLFRPFQKSSCDEADTKPGVGLGLSLCRRLARALGGDLIHAPQKGGGACFQLKLPQKH